MASKRALRRKSCARKKRYASYSDATRSIAGLYRQGKKDGMLLVYACQFCGGFHFGHPPAHILQSIRQSRETT
jgi:hypothetical protein